MGITQSQAVTCVFIKKVSDGTPLLVAACHVNDTQIAGTPAKIALFKSGVRERLKIKEMGIICKQLGITYSWKTESDGEPFVKVTMTNLIDEIIEIVEKNRGKPLKEHIVPALPGQILLARNNKFKDAKLYKTVVGKLMYLVHNLLIDLDNAV